MIASAPEPRVVPLGRAMIEAAADVHMGAFAGYMNARLGRAYVRAFLSWFAGGAQGAVALASLDASDRLLGYVVGAPLGYARAMTRALLVPALRGVVQRPALLFDARIRAAAGARLAGLAGRREPARPMPELPAPVMSLVGIGVAAQGRGRGHGRALVQGFELAARARRMPSLRLSVYPENLDARRLYERCGWTAFAGAVPAGAAMYYSKVLS